MIGSVVKYFRFSFDYVLWGIGYTNLIMLLATIPVYESEYDEDGNKNKKGEVIDFGNDTHSLANFINNQR